MYPYHSTTSLTLRAKLSFSNNHHISLYNNDNCSYCYGSQPPTLFYAAPRNPRFIYYGYLLRRQASLFRFEPSRTFLLPRRGVRVCDEAIGLLAEKERRCCCCCCCRCCGREGFCSGDGGSERSWKGDFEKSLKKERSWSGDEGRFSRKEGIRTGEGGGESRRSDNTLVKKSSLLRDTEDKGGERRRVVAESSSRGGRKKGYGVSRVDVEEKVVREIRNCEGDVNVGRDSRHEKRGEFDSWRGSGREAREESVYKEPERSRRQIGFHGRDGSAKNSSSRRAGYDLKIRDEEENFENWRDSGRDAREESVYREQEGSRKQLGFHGRDNSAKDSSSRKEVYGLRIRDEEENVEDWMDSRREEREGYVQEDKLNISSDRDRYSNYRNESSARNVDRGESSTSFVRRQSEVDRQDVGQVELRKSSFRDSNVERVSTSQRHFEEERVKDREERFNSVKNLVQVSRDERTQNDRRTIDKMELNKQYETRHSDSRFHLSDKKRANSSESYVEIKGYNGSSSSSRRHIEEERVKDREDRFNSVKNVVQVLGDERIKSNEQKETHRIDSRIHLSDKERANASGSYVEIKVYDGNSSSSQKRQDEERIKSREDKATSAENLVQVRRDERTQVSQQSIDKLEFDEQNENQTTSSKIHAIGNERTNNRKSSLQIITDERISNLQEMSTTRIENRKETSSQMKETQISIGSFHGGSSSALESASRLDESSATYVGEFVSKLRQETSASDSSEISKEKTVTGTNQGATIVEVNEEKYTDEGGRQTSSRSGMKGPADEMWEIKGMSSSNQPYKIEESKDDSSTTEVVGSKTSLEITENAIARRSHRSLWAYIADVMKIGWGHRAQSHNSNQKPGPISSSNESISSEAWFSGHEPDENDDESKKEKDASPNELVSSKQKQLGEQSTQVDLLTSVRRTEEIERGEGETRNNQMHGSGSQKPEEEFGRQKYPEVSGMVDNDGILRRRNSWTKELVPKGSFIQQFHPDPSTSLGTMNTGSPSKVDLKPMEGEKGRKVTISSVDQTSVPIPGKVAPSISEIGSVKMPGMGVGELEGEIIIEKVPELGGTEERDGELKRRKLQRNKQVLRVQFDEWEEAYKHEIEQRKMDEFFMREALLEAKKAADTWEVPVGAVLVQNGKIIARGCNLVEELRDSTAHAEMICIREASNLLRTWRLAETTLYVTLEPCAMCAGAILQARIETVVWGAPNKLLGADGSWVRLFPSGDGGTTSSLDPPNQIAGPVHPFHPKITIRRGILATECSEAMQQFFQLRRRKKNITKPEQPSPPPSRLHVSAHPTKLFTKMHDLFCIMFCL